jgi:integrase
MNYLTQDEVIRLLKVIPDLRDRTALMVMYLHGLRVSEATALTVSDVIDGYIIVQRLKGSAKTIQPMIPHSDPYLDEKTAIGVIIPRYGLKPQDHLFGAHDRFHYYRLMQRAAKTAGIPKHLAHPHALKHAIGMRLVSHMELKDLQQYLGHKALSSTGIYLHSTDAKASAAALAALRGDK